MSKQTVGISPGGLTSGGAIQVLVAAVPHFLREGGLCAGTAAPAPWSTHVHRDSLTLEGSRAKKCHSKDQLSSHSCCQQPPAASPEEKTFLCVPRGFIPAGFPVLMACPRHQPQSESGACSQGPSLIPASFPASYRHKLGRGKTPALHHTLHNFY